MGNVQGGTATTRRHRRMAADHQVYCDGHRAARSETTDAHTTDSGRARGEAQRVSPRLVWAMTTATMAMTLIGLLGRWNNLPTWWTSVATSALLMSAAVVLVAAAIVDARCRRLPDRFTIAAGVAVVGAAVVAATTEPVLGAVAFTLPLLLVHLVDPAAMGFGDVKIALVLGAACGLVDWRLSLVALLTAAAAASVIAIARRVNSIAFGPALVGATVAVVAPGMVAGSPLGWLS